MNLLHTGASLAALCLLGAAASAQTCLTSTFVSNNSGGAGWVNLFDVSIGPAAGLTFQTIDINCLSAAGTPVMIEVFTAPNTYLGNENNPGAWTMVASGMGTAQGSGTPTTIDISDFTLPAGVHGVGIHYVNTSPAYTNGTGANQNYGNGDMKMALGASVAGLFTGTIFTPRVANITLCYVVGSGGGITTYCTAKTNSLGCVPAVISSGSSSASATSGFKVGCNMVRNGKSGLLFYKVGGTQASVTFQCGTLCVGPSGIKRTPAQSAGGNPPPANDCSGVYGLDMNAFAAGLAGGNPDPGLLVAGNLVHCQWWGRDQGFPAPCNTTLSDGGEYMIQP